MKYTVQNIGYPTSNAIPADAWKTYSKHVSLWAAMRAITKYTAHLDYGSWDDHYRIIAPDGHVVSIWEQNEEQSKHGPR